MTKQVACSTEIGALTTVSEKSVTEPKDRTLLGATTLGQSGPGRNGNEGVLCIPQSSSNTGTSPSDRLVSYLGHSLERVLPLRRDAVIVFFKWWWWYVYIYVQVWVYIYIYTFSPDDPKTSMELNCLVEMRIAKGVFSICSLSSGFWLLGK